MAGGIYLVQTDSSLVELGEQGYVTGHPPAFPYRLSPPHAGRSGRPKLPASVALYPARGSRSVQEGGARGGGRSIIFSFYQDAIPNARRGEACQ